MSIKKENRLSGRSRAFALALLAALVLAGMAVAQVSPAELRDPGLQAQEQAYIAKMMALNGAVGHMTFPFVFAPSRYIGLDPKDQADADTRGLEFVVFHDRVVLKLSGNYNAAFSAALLQPNERARAVLHDVVVPVLRLLPEYFSSHDDFDAFGFEISYHVRSKSRSYAYEGGENLVLVFNKSDALRYPFLQDTAQQQQILDNSEVYVNGERLGLSLEGPDPRPVDAAAEAYRTAAFSPPARSSRNKPDAAALSSRYGSPAVVRDPAQRAGIGLVDAPSAAKFGASGGGTFEPGAYNQPGAITTGPVDNAQIPSASPVPTAPPETDRLQARHQAQLDALAREGASLHLVAYAPPSLVVFRNQVMLQITMRNPARFDRSSGSIYKRTAQSFDLFLAPQLKALVDKMPDAAEVTGLDVTVLDDFTATASPSSSASSEALEFVLLLKPLRQFVNAEITNQELINQSVVLVNGVRIALNLQLVE
jgi:hypothetical protein